MEKNLIAEFTEQNSVTNRTPMLPVALTLLRQQQAQGDYAQEQAQWQRFQRDENLLFQPQAQTRSYQQVQGELQITEQAQLTVSVSKELVSPDGKIKVSVSADNTVHLISIAAKAKLLQIQLEAKAESIRFSSDNKMLLIGSTDNKVRLINIAAHTEILQLQLGATIESVGFSLK